MRFQSIYEPPSLKDLQPALRADLARQALLLLSVAGCVTIVVAPLLKSPAGYALFSMICHQNPDRSWFLDGAPLAVCIRCSSIYAGFLIGLAARVRPRTWLVRTSVLTLGLEFVVARLVGLDLEGLRAMSGLFFGLAASGFVELGFRGLLSHTRIARLRAPGRILT